MIINLDPNKAHGHDMISIQIIKICGEYICKPLGTIFGHAWKIGSFAHNGKKQKTRSKQLSPHFFIACFKQNIRKVII